MLCSEATLVNYGFQKVRAVTLRCRAWTCELCQPMRRGQLVGLAQSGNPTTFITLTVSRKSGNDPEARARALVDAWRQIVKRAKRMYAYRSIPYLAVFEATKAGEPHLHILARVRWIDQRWMSAQLDALIGAPICDIRRIQGASHVAHYIAKYVGKGPGKFGTCKRYWTTRDWRQVPKREPRPSEGYSRRWHRVAEHIGTIYLNLWRTHYRLISDPSRDYFEMKRPP